MIPTFNPEGNLPEGLHPASEDEFLSRFSISSARRKWLGERLQELFALAKATGKLERIFVWGSFVSAKESPDDVDLLLLVSDDFQVADVPVECQVLFDYVAAKVRFQTDVFWSKSSLEAKVLELWLA